MLTSLWSTITISVLCLGFYLLARQSALLTRHVYAPYSLEARGAAAFPGVWGGRELRGDGAAVSAGEAGLELQCSSDTFATTCGCSAMRWSLRAR